MEHSDPVPLSDFRGIIESNRHELVLSYTNVRELAVPLVTTGDILKVRAMLNALESLPICYIREGFIIDNEIRSAASAFEKGIEYAPIDPFVRRWDYTFHSGESPARDYVGYSVFDIIYSIYRQQPGTLLYDRRFADELRRRFATERQMPKNVKKSPAANFPDAIERQMMQRGVPIPDAGVKRFATWVRADPSRCPGYRLSYEMYHAVQANLTDVPKDGDIPDLAHVPAMPYVDYLTLDRRMKSYAGRVYLKLQKSAASLPYQVELFRSLAELLPRL